MCVPSVGDMLREASMGYLRASLVVQIVLAVYFQAVLWFPLGAWNDQPGKRLIAVVRSGEAPVAAFGFAVVMLLPVLLFALAYWRKWSWLMWLGLAGYGTWAVLQVQSWWIPYIFGADARALRNEKALERTTKLLPSLTNHHAPDGMHFVLDVLLFAVVALTLIGLLKQAGPKGLSMRRP
ncbi:MAG TPA: hypothetical protein VEU31_11070 [Candidatus Acidoferrales bacterium]|nr:hypothetical protein [Candidatus Acidoferrales bacterium]